MEKIVFYGKGGIGKTTVATNISADFARRGMRVLHVGCDPKQDSTLKLLKSDEIPSTVIGRLVERGQDLKREDIINEGWSGIDCIESGGPEPGMGCGGRGISRMIEEMEKLGLLSSGEYDTAVFDVLGDVVCGGFAAPMKLGFAEKVFIVVSEENMSIYAANNIAKAVVNYAPNGVRLGGLIANLRSSRGVVPEHLSRFAAILNTGIIGVIPKSPLILRADFLNKTVIEMEPESDVAGTFRKLADFILELKPDTLPLPTPLSQERFLSMSKRLFRD